MFPYLLVCLLYHSTVSLSPSSQDVSCEERSEERGECEERSEATSRRLLIVAVCCIRKDRIVTQFLLLLLCSSLPSLLIQSHLLPTQRVQFSTVDRVPKVVEGAVGYEGQ